MIFATTSSCNTLELCKGLCNPHAIPLISYSSVNEGNPERGLGRHEEPRDSRCQSGMFGNL